MIKKIDSMGEFLQKQPYNLTIARHNLGIHQMRIMARIIEALQPSMTIDIDYEERIPDVYLTLSVKDLIKGTNVQPLRLALNSLMKKIVRIMHYLPHKATHLEIGMPIIQAYEHIHGSSFVQLKIPGKLIPQLVDLARGYTKYSINVAFNTSSPNVFKLYQYIAHFREKKQIQCNVSTLRKWLQLEEKYAKPAKIKQRILNPAIRELSQKADVWFDIAERITEGRRMIGWRFNIYKKKEVRKPTNLTSSLKKKEPISKLEQDLVTKFGLGVKQAKNVVKKVDKKHLFKELYAINLRIINNEIKNIGGYTVKYLEEKFDIKI